MTLVEFLEARLAEDERWAREPTLMRRKSWECEAKRAILKELGDYDDGYIWAAGEAYRAEDALRALARVYRDHPDYAQLGLGKR